MCNKNNIQFRVIYYCREMAVILSYVLCAFVRIKKGLLINN